MKEIYMQISGMYYVTFFSFFREQKELMDCDHTS